MSTQVNTILYDNELSGIRRYAVRNWSGKIYRIPRGKVSEISNVVDFINNPCVFILKGYKDNQEAYFIGETDDPTTEIMLHKVPEEDFWNEAILLFNDMDDKLSKGVSKYIEASLYKIAKNNEKNSLGLILMNTKAPRAVSLALYDQDMAEEFLDRVISIRDLLGLNNLFKDEVRGEKLEVLTLKSKYGEAKGSLTESGFIVYKDSVCAPNFTFATSKAIVELGNQLRKAGIIVKDVFAKDYEFKTPSAASSVVAGYSSNGYKLWKDEKGLSLADREEAEQK